MRTNAGGIAATIVALFLGLLVVTQIKAQDVYTRSLQLETPSSLTTLIANLAERNNGLREEIFDLRLRTEAARQDAANGTGSLTEAQRQELLNVAAKCPVHKLMTQVTTEVVTELAPAAG